MSPRRVVIAGGSLGGLTAGLLLSDLGLDVTIHERSPAELEQRGAGIGFLPDSYRYLVERAGVALTVIQGDFTEASGAAAGAQVARGTIQADALFAANDAMAIGALVALKGHGIAVPGQVRVAGFDDIPLARLVTPALTTMLAERARRRGSTARYQRPPPSASARAKGASPPAQHPRPCPSPVS